MSDATSSQDIGPPERAQIEIGCIPIACAAPLYYAKHEALFERHGLDVTLRPIAGWSGVKELMAHGRLEVAHMLTPMPLAARLGIDGKPADLRLIAIQNVNGSALTLARRHAGVKSAREMKGFVFGVPYLHSMQNYILCDYLAKSGLDPRADVTIEEVAPPRVPYYLKKGWLDAVLIAEPFNEIVAQRGHGFIFALSRDLWPGHPCCGLVATPRFLEQCPRTARAILAAVIEAQRALHDASHEARQRAAQQLGPLNCWGAAGAHALERVFAGDVTDADGHARSVPDRIDFIPYPFPEYGAWILSQMRRWGHWTGDADRRAIVGEVFTTEATRRLARELGFPEAAPCLAGVEPCLVEATPRPASGAMSQGSPASRRYDLPSPVRERLSEILERLADVAGGRDLSLEVTSDDELGWLEQSLVGTIRTLRFAREALDERLELEEEALRQERIIASQSELIGALSAPILPVLDGVLVLPLIGRLDHDRAAHILSLVLDEISARKARLLLVDITGVPALDEAVVRHLLRIAEGAGLLGAECILVGVSPAVAQALVQLGNDARLPRTMRDLQSGIAYALAGRAPPPSLPRQSSA